MGVIGLSSRNNFYRKRGRQGESGQMTVEFVVVFPVLIIVAVIAVNALLFFSECAAFDRIARDAVRTYATSPGYGQTSDHACASIGSSIDKAMNKDNLDAEVIVEGGGAGLTTYTATLKFVPTLFGLGLKSQVFGVALPALVHGTSLTIDPYRPGVFL